MNPHLNKALAALKGAGAQGLPPSSTVEAASDGSKWSGKKSSGDPWELIKNRQDSYNVVC